MSIIRQLYDDIDLLAIPTPDERQVVYDVKLALHILLDIKEQIERKGEACISSMISDGAVALIEKKITSLGWCISRHERDERACLWIIPPDDWTPKRTDAIVGHIRS